MLARTRISFEHTIDVLSHLPRLKFSAWLAANLVLFSHSAWSEVRYDLIDLREAPSTVGSAYLEPTGLNNLGHVVGYYTLVQPEYQSRGFLYDGVTVTDIPAWGLSNVTAKGINDTGQIVGMAEVSSGLLHAFLSSGGTTVDLGKFQPVAINGRGQVAAQSVVIPGPDGAIWTAGEIVNLGALGGSFTRTTDLNDVGQVTGYSSVEDFTPSHAFLWTEGRMIDLDTRGIARGGSAGNGINNLGQVVGYMDKASGTNERHAALFSAGVMVDLGTLGGPQSVAQAINNHGVIVGTSYSTPVGGVRAFVYSNGRMEDLNALVDFGRNDLGQLGDPRLFDAIAINDRGQILCVGNGHHGSSGFLLTPKEVVSPSYISNFSIRAQGGIDAQMIVGGFVLKGSQTMLLRAVGEELARMGVPSAMKDPAISVHRGGATLFSNNNWGDGSAAEEVAAAAASAGAFPLTKNSRDAALLASLSEGIYTFRATPTDSQGGVAIIEAYTTVPNSSRLVNFSGRAHVGRGADALIAGFVIVGSAPRKILVRAVGPGLATYGVADFLPDPELAVFQGSKLIAMNDNWSGSATVAQVKASSRAVGAFPLEPESTDAALVLLLSPGIYSVVVTAVGASTGTSLVEVYDAP